MSKFTLIAESTHSCLEFLALVEGSVVAVFASVALVTSVDSWGVLLGVWAFVLRAGLWQILVSELLESELFSCVEHEGVPACCSIVIESFAH